MRRVFASLLLAACFVPTLCATWVTYTARFRSNGLWYAGSDHVFVGCDDGGDGRWCGWDWEHDPAEWLNNGTSGSMTTKWNFEGITCVDATDTCSAVGMKLPNGTEVRLGLASGGAMASGLYSSWPESDHRKQVYYIVNSNPATTTTGTGTFQLSATRGGEALPIGTGSGIKMTYAGWKHVIQFNVVPISYVSINTSTGLLTAVDATGTPRNHGLSTGNSVYFVQTGSNTPPSDAVLSGAGSQYCIAVIDAQTFYARPMINNDATCPTTNVPPNNTGIMQCNPSGDSANCTIVSGVWPGPTMGFKITSFTSGAPSNVAVDTLYWTLSPVTSPPFAFTANKEDSMTGTYKIVPSEAFTANYEVVYQQFSDTGTNAAVYSYNMGNGGNFYIRSITGYPQGTMFSCRQLGYVKPGTIMGSSSDQFCGVNNNEGAASMVAKVPAIADAGDYTVSVTFGPNPTGTYSPETTDSKTFQFTLHAVELTPLQRANPTPESFTAIPNLAQWEQLMVDNVDGGRGYTSTGQRQYLSCPPGVRETREGVRTYMTTLYSGANLDYWFTQDKRGQFYGRKTYYDSAEYKFKAWESTITDQENFNNCGDDLAWWYAYNLDPNPGQVACCGVTGSWGLYKAYGRWLNHPGDPFGQRGEKFKQALLRSSQAGQGFLTLGRVNDTGTREMAWATEMWHLTGMINGGSWPAWYKDAIDVNLMWMYQWAVDADAALFHQVFFGGLTEEQLSEWYKLTRDPRVPVVMKAYSDRHWNYWLNQETWQSYYNVYPFGERCGTACQLYTDPQLNCFLVYLNWFIWRITGDNTYRDRGDALFAHMYDQGVPFYMKMSNEIYFRTMDGVAIRSKETNPW
jgi:hypothetical protein